jgi:hypothetical protein
MRRRAVIVFNPGEDGAENYCKGVLRDVANYRSFLMGPTGGLWQGSEVVDMGRPSVADLRSAIAGWTAFDYVFVLFTGHGWYSTSINSTVLELRKGQEIDSTELRLASGKQTIVLDCCREKHAGLPTIVALSEKLARAAPTINPNDCRRLYEQRIQECASELVVMYASSIGQKAGDDAQRGGVYAHNLIDASLAWVENSTVDTSRKYDIFSVVQAHEAAIPRVARERGTRQTPTIEKPKSGPYYPFCIVA